jgi:hypothetical protein
LPFDANFNDDENLLYWKWKGRVTGDDFLYAIGQATEIAGYTPGANIISDFTEAKHLLSFDILSKSSDLLQIYEKQYGSSKIAIIVANLRDYGLATMFSILTKVTPIKSKVFMNVEEARQWLGIKNS